jgi:ferredoxin
MVSMTAVKETPSGPIAEPTSVFLCSDVVKGKSSARIVDALATFSDGPFDVNVHVVRKLCSSPSKLSEALKGTRTQRVVVGCRKGAEIRDEVNAIFRRAGLHGSAATVLDMMPGAGADRELVDAQLAAWIRAAAQRVSRADLSAPIRERRASASARYSRRNLFHPGDVARRPVASWSMDRCDCGGASSACVDACPVGALSLVGRRVSVDQDLCNGCGACVGICGSGAMSLCGLTIEMLEAEANSLVKDAYGLETQPGVAIVCASATVKAPIGGDWLPLEVPSLEMVGVGWLLQVIAADVSVRLIGCDDDRCGARARNIVKLCSALANEAAPGRCREARYDVEGVPACSEIKLARFSAIANQSTVAIKFSEPLATVKALSVLGSTGGIQGSDAAAISAHDEPLHPKQSRPWRIESDMSPLGEITVDGVRCSACGCCTSACPTGALATGETQPAGFVLTLDLAACSACGACVTSCPESAISLLHVVDSSRLAAGRHTVVEVAGNTRCTSCGCVLAEGLATSIIGDRLAASHPKLAERLLLEVKCVDCLLTT